jgi:hypothetical protein
MSRSQKMSHGFLAPRLLEQRGLLRAPKWSTFAGHFIVRRDGQ